MRMPMLPREGRRAPAPCPEHIGAFPRCRARRQLELEDYIRTCDVDMLLGLVPGEDALEERSRGWGGARLADAEDGSWARIRCQVAALGHHSHECLKLGGGARCGMCGIGISAVT